MVRDKRWITTGEAAALLGYSPDHFRRKFKGLLPSRRYPGGHRRWLAEAVQRLVDEDRRAG